MTTGNNASLIKELKRYDNEAGYELSHEEMNVKMENTVKGLLEAGEDILDELHELLIDDETWSCYYSLKIIREIGSERSIPFLILFLVEYDDSDFLECPEEASLALSEMGSAAVEPLLAGVEAIFRCEEYLLFLVGAMTSIVDDRVFNFMRCTLEDYIAKPEKYMEWFDIIPFMFDLDKHGNEETTVPLLKAILELEHLHEFEKREIRDTILKIEDPEGWEESLNRDMERMEALLGPLDDGTDMGNKSASKRKVKIGKNQPCPCGSGKKYKRCCRNKNLKEA